MSPSVDEGSLRRDLLEILQDEGISERDAEYIVGRTLQRIADSVPRMERE
jgi:hypothetical protein